MNTHTQHESTGADPETDICVCLAAPSSTYTQPGQQTAAAIEGYHRITSPVSSPADHCQEDVRTRSIVLAAIHVGAGLGVRIVIGAAEATDSSRVPDRRYKWK